MTKKKTPDSGKYLAAAELLAKHNRWRRGADDVDPTDPTDIDRPGSYAGVRTIVEWSRPGRGGRQFDLFMQAQSGGGCTSELGLCEVVN